MRFKRPCRKCGEIFRPLGKYTKLCDKCNNQPKGTYGIKSTDAAADKERKKHKALIRLSKLKHTPKKPIQAHH